MAMQCFLDIFGLFSCKIYSRWVKFEFLTYPSSESTPLCGNKSISTTHAQLLMKFVSQSSYFGKHYFLSFFPFKNVLRKNREAKRIEI